MKIRIQPTNLAVAILPADKFQNLQIEATPTWLKYYKSDSSEPQRKYQLGFTYNAWGECAKALTFLEAAQKADPKIRGLAVEIAFSYNCLGQFDNAVKVLSAALETSPTDAYTYKELIFSQIKLNQLNKASETFQRALTVCKDTRYHAESSYNLLYGYFAIKDKVNFQKWLSEANKRSLGTSRMAAIKGMEVQMSRLNLS